MLRYFVAGVVALAALLIAVPAPVASAATLPELLPPGKGLGLALENCSSCHSVVCAVKGQRTKDRWGSLKKDHKDKVANLSDAELDTLFAYLADNFNDTKPEPKLPPALAELGSCTPF